MFDHLLTVIVGAASDRIVENYVQLGSMKREHWMPPVTPASFCIPYTTVLVVLEYGTRKVQCTMPIIGTPRGLLLDYWVLLYIFTNLRFPVVSIEPRFLLPKPKPHVVKCQLSVLCRS